MRQLSFFAPRACWRSLIRRRPFWEQSSFSILWSYTLRWLSSLKIEIQYFNQFAPWRVTELNWNPKNFRERMSTFCNVLIFITSLHQGVHGCTFFLKSIRACGFRVEIDKRMVTLVDGVLISTFQLILDSNGEPRHATSYCSVESLNYCVGLVLVRGYNPLANWLQVHAVEDILDFGETALSWPTESVTTTNSMLCSTAF